MKVIHGINGPGLPIKNSVATIGVFDGVHLGHRKVIAKVVSRAKGSGMKSVVVTFDPHPLKVIRPAAKVPSIMSLTHRIKLIGKLGVDYLVILSFTKVFSRLLPEDFLRSILIGRLGARELYVGENFYFGKGAKAGAAALRAIGRAAGLKVKTVRPVKVASQIASSSRIRRLILKGRIDEAAALLGRAVSVLGTVVSGVRLARSLGYPTANLNPHHEAVPPSGVYIVKVHFGHKLFNGLLNIGTKPTFYAPRDRETAIEVHMFDFRGDIYSRDLEVFFIKRIRPERHFSDRHLLIEQIKADEKAARRFLSKHKKLYNRGIIC